MSDLYSRARAVIHAKHDQHAERRRNAIDTVILGTVPLLAIAVAFASGWSLYDLGRHFGMPGWTAWAVFALIDLVWFQSAIVVIKNQRSPHRAIEAHRRMQGMFRVSVSANFVHGLILFGLTLDGFVAGAVFALFPIGFKVAFANAYPDFVKRARQAGFGGELADAFHTEVLMTIMAGVDQAKAELAQSTEQQPAQLDPVVIRGESTPVHAPDQQANREPTAEPAMVQAAAQSGSGQPDQIENQVNTLLDRLKKDERITKARAAEILGIPESTAYRRLKDAEALHRQYP